METLKKVWRNLPWVQIKKVAVGALIAVIGALLTYFSEVVTTIDWGEWTPFVTAGFSVLANAIRKAIL